MNYCKKQDTENVDELKAPVKTNRAFSPAVPEADQATLMP